MERKKYSTGGHEKSFLFGAAARRWVSIHLKCPVTTLINRLLVDKHWQFGQDDLNLCYLKNNNWNKESVPVDLTNVGFYVMRCWMRVIKKNLKKNSSGCRLFRAFFHTHKHTITFQHGGLWGGDRIFLFSSFVCQRDDNRSASSVLTTLSGRLQHKSGKERLLHRIYRCISFNLWNSSKETERERNENQETKITKVSLFASSGHSSIDTFFSLIKLPTSWSEMLEDSQSLYN